MMKTAVLAAAAIVKPSVESMSRRPLATQRFPWTKNRMALSLTDEPTSALPRFEAPLRGALGRAAAELRSV